MNIKVLSFGLFNLLTLLLSSNMKAEIDETIVAASLFPVSIDDSANSINVISAEDIENTPHLNLADLLRDLPGISVSQSGVLGSQIQVRVRGSEANHLLVLVDGVEVNNASQNDEFNWGNIIPTDIEKIEVIRGPQSSMFGSDAMAGVVNIITKRATTSRSSNVFSELGSFNSHKYGFSNGASNSNLDFRFGATKFKTDGANISRFGNEKDGYENDSLNFKSNLKISDSSGLSLIGSYSSGNNEYDADIDFDGLVDDQDKYAKFKNHHFGFKYNYLNSEDNFSQQVLISESNNQSSDFTNDIFDTRVKSSKNQIRSVSTLFWDNSNRRISLLLEHENEDFKQQGPINDYGIYGIFDPNQQRTRKTDSASIEYRTKLDQGSIFAVSSRYDKNSQFKNGTTARAELILSLSKSLKLKGSYGTAIKNPTFTERFGYYTNFIGNPDLQPEYSKNLELGFDFDLQNYNSLFSATLFKSRLVDEINGNFLDPVTFGYTAINMEGKSLREGVELNFSRKLSERFKINGSYTYTDSIEPNSSGIYVDELRRPKHISSININWNSSNRLFLTANIRHRSSQIDIVFPNRVTLPEVTLLNINAKYKLNNKSIINFQLNNLLDESYEEVYGYRALGFSAHLGIRYQF